MVASLFSSSKDPILLYSLKGGFPGIYAEGFSWSCARAGVSVVVAYLGGSTTTNYEGLMMRVSCDTKRALSSSQRVLRCCFIGSYPLNSPVTLLVPLKANYTAHFEGYYFFVLVAHKQRGSKLIQMWQVTHQHNIF